MRNTLYKANRVVKQNWMLCSGLALAASCFSLPLAAQTWVNYDSFSGSAINPAKWAGEEGKTNGAVRTEAKRALASGQLRIEAKGYADTYSDSGVSSSRNALVFSRSGAISSLRATITMRSLSLAPCAANASPSIARARLFGYFFNAGDPEPGNYYNNVYAGIAVFRASNSTDPAGVMRVLAFTGICTDNDCQTSTTLGSQQLGTVPMATPVALQVEWDAVNHRFAFQRDAETKVFLPYSVRDTAMTFTPTKRLEIKNDMANCSASRVAVAASADFDNVATNPLPLAKQSPSRHLATQDESDPLLPEYELETGGGE